MSFGRSSAVAWGYALGLNRSHYDYASAVGDGTGNSAVMACLAWISRAFPEAPIQVLTPKGDGYEPIAGHAMIELLEQPNPYYSGPVLWSATLAGFHTDGNAYWIKERSTAGRVVALWFAPHDALEPVSDSATEFLQYYRYRVDGKEYRLDPADVVHFRNGLDPANPRKGMAPLKSALREIYADDEAALFFGALLRNMGVPGILIAPDGDGVELQDGDAEQIKASYKQKFGGDNRGEPMVLSGKTKVQVLSFTPEQMDLSALRRLPEERITAVLGIPAVVVGLGAGLEHSTYSNYEQARAAAWEDSISPTQRMLAADLKTQLLPDFDSNPRNRVMFDQRAVRVLQPDQNALVARTVQLLAAGAVTVAEARRQAGLSAGPEHEFYLLPNTATVSATLADALAPEPVAPDPALLDMRRPAALAAGG